MSESSQMIIVLDEIEFDDQWDKLKMIEFVIMLNVTSMNVLCLNGKMMRELMRE